MGEKKPKKTGMSLITLDESITELQAELEKIAAENEGEIPEDKFKALVELQAQVPEKLQNIVKFIRYCESLVDMYKAEKKRIGDKQSVVENTIKRIKQYIKFYMEIKKEKKINAITADITLCEKKALEIEKDEAGYEKHDAIPDQYCTFNFALTDVALADELIKAIRAKEQIQIMIISPEKGPMLLDSTWEVSRVPDRDVITALLEANQKIEKEDQKVVIPGCRLVDNNHIMIR